MRDGSTEFMTLGRHHPTVQRLRALRRDRARRDAEGVFVAEGLHLAAEALAAQAPIELALTSPRLAATSEGRALAEGLARSDVPRAEVADGLLDSLQEARSPQPILLVVRRRVHTLASVLGQAGVPLVAVAHGVQEPGNLGAILRTADAAGASGLVACGPSADPYHPRAIRATMGSIFRLPVLRADVDAVLSDLRARGLVLIGADTREGTGYVRCDFRRPVALFIGSEGGGLPSDLSATLDERVHISLRAGVESLSVGAATAVLLFEAARQRAADL